MIWLIGNKGMLGQDVEKLLKRKRLSYLASDKEVDIKNYQILKEFTKDIKIEWIINCTGYTDVDKAEKEIEKAFLINRDGVRNISKIALEKQAKLVHISTDYVFNGEKNKHLSYTEDDKTEPINLYGKSKLAGEKETKETFKKYFIIRTAWLYGRGGKNFVSTMLKLFKEKEEIKVVSDQWGSPTYTVDLAEVILKMINNDSDKFGIYHFTNEGVTNWYEFAREIYRKSKKLGIIDSNKEVGIRGIETKEYPTPAQRPKWSLLSKEKIKRELNLDIRNWEGALEDFLTTLSLQTK
ncbi:MAG: dTDP-4-dehydrorhamnose reductase [Candidatus Omnitrophica bacterium]|nr:dTDP-4-dehydrorhamnose reductase [Candidatus Omnitrophota bacterium]